jgi:hypothetical protein
MVVIAKHEYYDAYRQLQQLSFRASVLVFASTRDADAVCAVKILTSLLKLDSVPFSVVPVTDFEHLQAQAKAHLEAAEGDEPEPRAIVMIGCGATESTSDVRPPPLDHVSRPISRDAREGLRHGSNTRPWAYVWLYGPVCIAPRHNVGPCLKADPAPY